MAIKAIKFKLVGRREIAQDTYEIQLGIDGVFDYLAGQYVVIKIDKKVEDGKGTTRSFSLSSSPLNKEYISTCFRLPDKHSEFKEFIMTCPIGTVLIVDGPKGKFVLPEKINKRVLMIAGGVGITPFISMISFVTESKSKQKIKLIYTDKSEERMAYFDELVKLESENKNFSFVSRMKRVDEDFLKKNVDLKEDIFYVCGTPEMVKSVGEMFKGLGVGEDRIKFEEFSGY